MRFLSFFFSALLLSASAQAAAPFLTPHSTATPQARAGNKTPEPSFKAKPVLSLLLTTPSGAQHRSPYTPGKLTIPCELLKTCVR